eukprot:gene11788-biopygen3292
MASRRGAATPPSRKRRLRHCLVKRRCGVKHCYYYQDETKSVRG